MGHSGRSPVLLRLSTLRRFQAWLWRNERRTAILLTITFAALLASVPAFAISEMTGLRTVHALYPLRTALVRLGPGSYSLDEDPDAFDFPVNFGDLIITGPDGPVHAQETPYAMSPGDLGGLLLGVGIYVQAARFKVSHAGVYHFSVADPDAGSPLFVSEPYSASAWRTGPWALAIIAALIMLARTGLRLRASRRAWRDQSSRPAVRLLEQSASPPLP